MKKQILKVGKNGALVARVRDNGEVFEYVSAWAFDPNTETWGQGHYFTPHGDYTTAEALKDATDHFNANYR
jgi:hypothetical protein